MNKTELNKRIQGLNEFMLADSDKKLLLLSISSDYTYNKAIALVNNEHTNKDWYSVDNKSCFKTWNEVDAFIDGLCLAKNTNFNDKDLER